MNCDWPKCEEEGHMLDLGVWLCETHKEIIRLIKQAWDLV